jgi:hypothetical protein
MKRKKPKTVQLKEFCCTRRYWACQTALLKVCCSRRLPRTLCTHIWSRSRSVAAFLARSLSAGNRHSDLTILSCLE